MRKPRCYKTMRVVIIPPRKSSWNHQDPNDYPPLDMPMFDYIEIQCVKHAGHECRHKARYKEKTYLWPK